VYSPQAHDLPTTIHHRQHAFLAAVNNNNNKSHDNVYGAVIVTKVIARVHPVHLMNVVLD